MQARIKLLISVLFIGIAIVITIATMFQSSILGGDTVDAGSFGISPPYIKATDLHPGDTFEQRIRILRGNADVEQKVTARFDDLEIADWFEVSPSETIIITKGEKYAYFNFKLTVPNDAYNGAYQGKVYFSISSNDNKKSGVSLALGARAEVSISVVGGQDSALSVADLADNDLVERLQGRFVIRAESQGQLYYLHPREKQIYYLSNADDFLKLLQEEGRGIGNILLNRIPLDFSYLEGTDSDKDGLPDLWEESLGTNLQDIDTDNDGFNDLEELKIGFSPLEQDRKIDLNLDIANSLGGFLLLQVENRGQVWYIEPVNNKRILLADIDNILTILEKIALGISEESYQELVQ